jgi:hypothetical protein
MIATWATLGLTVGLGTGRWPIRLLTFLSCRLQ